jgi:hypothetical protein
VRELIARGRTLAAGNVTAEARPLAAEAYSGDETDPVTADQWARTLIAIGGPDRSRGEAAMDAMGAVVMAWPPG